MNQEKFARIAESLRQYRRAELKDFEDELGGKPVSALYVDPLPNDAVLHSVLSSNTTFLLGRKGTGKSTIFAKAQNMLRERKDLLSTYIDVKSLCDVINTPEIPLQSIENSEIDVGIYRSHMIRKAFLGQIIAELLKEIDNLCESVPLWDFWKGTKKSLVDLRKSLTILQSKVREVALQEHELPILQKITSRWKSHQKTESGSGSNLGSKLNMSLDAPKVGFSASLNDFDRSLEDTEVYNEYSDVVLRTFPFNEIVTEIQTLLSESGLKRLVVFF